MPIKPPTATLLLSLAAAAMYLGYRALVPVATDIATEVDPAAADELRSLPNALPDVVLDDLRGVPTSIASWEGKPLLVNFWATWCAPCLREIPLLKEYQQDHPELTVVGIAIDRVEPVIAFADEMQFNYPVLVGPEAMDAAGAFGADFVAMPFTVFTGADGAVLGVHTGELHTEHLQNFSAVLEDLSGGVIDTPVARLRLAGRM